VKTIGLLGGKSWESIALRPRPEARPERARGEKDGVLQLLLSVDFAEIERLQVAGDWPRAGELLAADAKTLEAAGAELVLLCTNTMHKVAATVANVRLSPSWGHTTLAV
jgi:aspartate racemase